MRRMTASKPMDAEMNQVRASDAAVAGVAGRISAAEKAANNNVRAGDAVVRATIHITRKATGKVDTYEIVGTADTTPKEP